MKVFKFGGASINSAERIKNLKPILSPFRGDRLLIVISAMGKVTNALEEVVGAFFKGDKDIALELFQHIKQQHLSLLTELNIPEAVAEVRLRDIFTEVEWLLHDKPVRDFNYYYDQVVCCGELLSTLIVSIFLNQEGVDNGWIDVRDVLRTDDTFRDGVIDWNVTRQQTAQIILPVLNEKEIVITQGFIGSTDENESTTLGREGSDYTAAVFANILQARDVTIWKDVEGVMNADPKEFPEAVFLSALSYREVIEMAYYGAQVIHPKTIKPLQNLDIPLYVKCFLDPQLPGSVISGKGDEKLPPVVVYKRNQVLFTLSSRDFSFVEGEPVNALHEILKKIKIKPTLTQNAAISLMFCADHRPEKTSAAAAALEEFFDVMVETNLSLLTIRHYDGTFLSRLTKDKQVILEQKTPETVQLIMRD